MTPLQTDFRPPRSEARRWERTFEGKMKTGGQNRSDEDFFESIGITAATFTWTMAAFHSTCSLLLALATDTLLDWVGATIAWMIIITVTLIIYGRVKVWKRARRR